MSAISELEQIDPSGLLQLRVSRRTKPDEIGSGLEVRDLLLHTTYSGPVYFRHNSEPYTTLALAELATPVSASPEQNTLARAPTLQ